jgi:hypothetical protein
MLTIDTARVFEPLTKPSRYKGAWGGRGSGKSHFMAGAVVAACRGSSSLSPACGSPFLVRGAGASAMRIEAVRRLFPKCWFNESTTEAGLEALGYYHEKKDEQRDVGLGPSHDWSSHAADAFGLMAIAYEEPSRLAGMHRKIVYPPLGIV